ncbi:MAG: DUF5011 domain-containing protein [Firmicutes bacterium]|nr:DUF5011 domain-containing protein [Bacillota bacterium]
MKKLKLLILIFIFTLSLVGCQTNNDPKDLVPPNFIGTKDITYFIGSDEPNFLDGISATDSIDGDVTSNITYDDSEIDLTIPGIYTLTYYVSDSSNNQISTSVSIIVIETVVIEDTTPPLIIGVSPITYYLGDTEPDLLDGLVAFDPEDGTLTDEIVVDDSEINWVEIGIYNITYSVTDSAGNMYVITVQVTVRDLEQESNPDYLNIYYINDLHGAILEDDEQMGLSKIGNLILNEKYVSPMNTLFIAGGDILQGSLISNYFNGSSTIDVLNQMELDAFTIGNHEFDWGFDIITNFRDFSSGSMQAAFPLLGANIFYEDTITRPTNIDAYTVIEKGNLKIGIIGVIGSGLESSIATSRVTGYYFDDPVYWTSYYAEYLRTVEEVDVVLAVLHDNGISSGYNQSISALTGNQRVDAVFNGHSHSTYAQYITRTGTRLPYIQSGSSGSDLGKVTLEFDDMKNVTYASAENLTASSDSRLTLSNPSIDSVIETYVTQIEPLLNEVIITSGDYMSQVDLTYYMAELIRMASDSDIGFHNLGGTRAYISSGQDITIATLYQIFPFDNKIKTSYLTGAQINAFKNSSYGSYFSTRDENMVFEDNVYYKAATNDYVFDSPSNPFIYGVDLEDTGILIRDVLEQVMRNQALIYESFLLTHPIVLSSTPRIDVMLYYPKKNSELIYI